MSVVGCYDLHLYCDGLDCAAGEAGVYRAEYEATDEYGSKCRARARRAGWLLTKDGYCMCPSCRKRGARFDPEAT